MLSQSSKEFLRNPWSLGLSAAILASIGISMTLVIVAVQHKPSLVSKEYYENGRHFEQTVAEQAAARKALAWKSALSMADPLPLAKPTPIRLDVADKDGFALKGAAITVRAYRPSDANADFSVELRETEAGKYAGMIAFPLKGAWELVMRIRRGDDVFDVTQRIRVAG
jgi:nitrogen fixation protein FixH